MPFSFFQGVAHCITAPFGVEPHQAVDQAVGRDIELAHPIVNVSRVYPMRPAVFCVGFEGEEVGATFARYGRSSEL